MSSIIKSYDTNSLLSQEGLKSNEANIFTPAQPSYQMLYLIPKIFVFIYLQMCTLIQAIFKTCVSTFMYKVMLI